MREVQHKRKGKGTAEAARYNTMDEQNNKKGARETKAKVTKIYRNFINCKIVPFVTTSSVNMHSD